MQYFWAKGRKIFVKWLAVYNCQDRNKIERPKIFYNKYI